MREVIASTSATRQTQLVKPKILAPALEQFFASADMDRRTG